MPAASHATGQPRLWGYSGSIPHECRHLPYHRAFPRWSSTGDVLLDPMRLQHCISDGPRCRNTAPAPLIQARRPDPGPTITISWRLDGFRRPPRRDQIAIGRRHTPCLSFPRVPSLDAFGRRPRCLSHCRDRPSSETLHTFRRTGAISACPLGTRNRLCANNQRLEPEQLSLSNSMLGGGGRTPQDYPQ